jgi:transposase InsO family protein
MLAAIDLPLQPAVVNDVTRECLAAILDTSIWGRRVARELTGLIERRGKPGMIVSDNGTEFRSNAMFAWTHDNAIVWHFIAPGTPMQNGFCESFNGRIRDELLNETLFFDLDHVRTKLARWASDFNLRRPHSALNYMTLCGRTHRNKRSAAPHGVKPAETLIAAGWRSQGTRPNGPELFKTRDPRFEDMYRQHSPQLPLSLRALFKRSSKMPLPGSNAKPDSKSSAARVSSRL